MQTSLKMWRESASLILVARAAANVNANCNYKLLTMQRSTNAGFMPGAYVFPGGNISKADSSKDWLKLYENCGLSAKIFNKLRPSRNSAQIITSDAHSDEIPKYLSLRICAIREAFEESGILICKSKQADNREQSNTVWASSVEWNKVKEWQTRVHDNPDQFLKLCMEYQLYPDVWALKEWSNWVTPPPLKTRFDTIFFLVCFDEIPDTHAEESEVNQLEWSTPAEYIKRNIDQEIFFPPPQYYEINRLNNFGDISSLAEFANEREALGCERYFPYRIESHEGLYTILPGDDLYPESFDPTSDEIPFVDNVDSNKQNRLLHRTAMSYRIFVKNLTPKYNHSAPLPLKNKL